MPVSEDEKLVEVVALELRKFPCRCYDDQELDELRSREAVRAALQAARPLLEAQWLEAKTATAVMAMENNKVHVRKAREALEAEIREKVLREVIEDARCKDGRLGMLHPERLAELGGFEVPLYDLTEGAE